ncbi:hypothetical protein [Methylobacterium oxalidis]|uniref:hypothetical protein n=1 Tax=Methylobacterium oxalidis TaxID=944322 RepID=UPI0033162332
MTTTRGASPFRARQRRADRAADRLRAARRRFELSAAQVRSAALDQIERHGLIRVALRASLDRLAQSCPAEAWAGTGGGNPSAPRP